MTTATQTIDTRHTVETAEGARLQLTVAGPVIRGIAWSIDATIRAVLFYALVIVFSFSNPNTFDLDGSPEYFIGVAMLVYFALSWLYPIIFEATTGTTPGKRIFKLTVVHDNATPLTVGGSVIRNLLRFIDFLPMMYFVGLITCLSDTRFRRLGDLAAGTLVIYRDSEVSEGGAFSHGRSIAPPNGLTRDERLAIVDFAERCETLSSDRQRELASKLSHLMDVNDDPVETLKCWAEHILRGQTDA